MEGGVISRGQFSPMTPLWPLLSPFIIPSRYFYSAALCLPPLSFLHFPPPTFILFVVFSFFSPCRETSFVETSPSKSARIFLPRVESSKNFPHFTIRKLFTRGDKYFFLIDENRWTVSRNKQDRVVIRRFSFVKKLIAITFVSSRQPEKDTITEISVRI